MRIGIVVSLFAVVMVSAAYSCGGNSEQVTQANTGADIYNNNCLVCHGQDGKAGMSGATDLSTSVLSHEAAVDVVTNGRNGMRAFNELTKDQIEAVVSHIETLRKK